MFEVDKRRNWKKGVESEEQLNQEAKGREIPGLVQKGNCKVQGEGGKARVIK